MYMNTLRILTTLPRVTFIIAIILFLLVGTPILLAWTKPTLNPPQGNVAAPINTGANPQQKAGNLSAQSFSAFVTGGNGGIVYAQNHMRSPRYCDASGGNCLIPGSSSGGGGGGISSLTAGNGITLTPNPITSAGSIAANFTQVQQRITGTCPVGQAIRVVNANGTVGCQPIATVSTVYSCPVISVMNMSNGLESNCTGQLQLQPVCTYITAGNSGSNSGGSNRINTANCTRVGHLVP